jgi:hypothetical protein
VDQKKLKIAVAATFYTILNKSAALQGFGIVLCFDSHFIEVEFAQVKCRSVEVDGVYWINAFTCN